MHSISTSIPRISDCLFRDRAPHLPCSGEVGIAAARALLHFQWLRAFDRPDRLEWVVEDLESFYEDFEIKNDDLPQPGSLISVGGESFKSGRDWTVEEIRTQFSRARLPELSLIAFSNYEFSRRSFIPRSLLKPRLDELAQLIASELGLSSRIEPDATPCEELTFEKDPLQLLRKYAQRNALGLGISENTLYFGQRLADAPRSWRLSREVFDAELRWIDFEVRQLVHGDRWGSLHLAYACPVVPLDRITLRGWGDSVDGDYRVRRVELTWNPEGWRSEIEFKLDTQAHRFLSIQEEGGGCHAST